MPFDDAPIKTIYKPPSAYSLGGSVNLLDSSNVGVLELSDVAKTQILYGNPAFVLANKADREALNVEFNTVHRDPQFFDFIADGFGNLAAGIVNSVVPGSNIGDEKNVSNLVGNVLGGVASSFVNPAGIVSSVINKTDMAFSLSSAFNFANKVLAGPIGSISTNLLSGLMNPAVPVYQQALASASAFNSPTSMSIAETKSSPAQAAAFGNVGQSKFDTKGVINAAMTTSTTPAWLKPLAIGAAVLVALFLGYKLLFKRKR